MCWMASTIFTTYFIIYGAPQGSILAFFLLFINNLTLFLNCNALAHVDESAFSLFHHSSTCIQDLILQDHKLIEWWCITNDMAIRTSKSHYIRSYPLLESTRPSNA